MVPCKVADSGLQLVQGVSMAEGVEAVAVDACSVFLEPEESRLRVSRLQRRGKHVENFERKGDVPALPG